MIPAEKFYSNQFFTWDGANVQHCREQFGHERLTTFFTSEGLYFIRPTEEGKREGVFMLSEEEFKNLYRIENPRNRELAEAGYPAFTL